jgi:hypothetical protein
MELVYETGRMTSGVLVEWIEYKMRTATSFDSSLSLYWGQDHFEILPSKDGRGD